MRAKLVNETINFKRGLDPKEAMGTGEWSRGYKVIKEDELQFHDLSVFDKFHFNSKADTIDDITQEIDHLEIHPNILDKLGIVNFKSYYNKGPVIGLFGDWPKDFPFKTKPFMAHVSEDDGVSYLIKPEGYSYPRYIAELT